MSQMLPVTGFEFIESADFTEDFIRNLDKNNDAGYLFQTRLKHLFIYFVFLIN